MATSRKLLRSATAFVAVLATAPLASQASVIQLGVSGGPGLDQGSLCATTTGVACPADATFTLSGGATAAGSFSYDTSASTASFTLTLTQNANFNGETLLAGSTFSGSGVPVQLLTLSKTSQEISQIGAPLNGTASLSLGPSALPLIEATPAISALSCSLGSKVDLCAVSLGAGGLEVGPDSSGTDYNAFLTFNVDAMPVPLPATAWLLVLGLSGYALLGRRGTQLI